MKPIEQAALECALACNVESIYVEGHHGQVSIDKFAAIIAAAMREGLGKDVISLEKERDQLRAALDVAEGALKWTQGQLQGDSGTGETYWETVPGYAQIAQALARIAEARK